MNEVEQGAAWGLTEAFDLRSQVLPRRRAFSRADLEMEVGASFNVKEPDLQVCMNLTPAESLVTRRHG